MNGTRVETCKKTFIDTFQINESVVKNLQTKNKQGHIVVTDGRGRHGSHPATPNYLTQLIEQHIDGFRKLENHYSRARQGQFYLSPDLNVDLMFRMFVDANPAVPNIESKETIYRRLFKKSGLTIGEPRTDTCKTCNLLAVQIRNAATAPLRAEATVEQSLHHATWAAAKAAMDQDLRDAVTDASYIVLCGDMQQVNE